MDRPMPEPLQDQQEGTVSQFLSTVVFWWLTAMGTLTLALAATIPSWVEYRQVVQLREQTQQQVDRLQKRVDRNNYFIESYRNSPQALDLLAISEFGYRRPDEAPLPLPQQVVMNFRPAGYTGMSSVRHTAGAASQPSSKVTAPANRIERYVEQAQALANHHLGTRRAIGLVEMFCDKTSRMGLTAAALAVLAAALFLCRTPSPTRD
jgi:hypothetical protein